MQDLTETQEAVTRGNILVLGSDPSDDSSAYDVFVKLGYSVSISASQTNSMRKGVVAISVRSEKINTDDYPDLLFVVRRGSGVDTITVNKATQRGIPVSNVPGANARAVAELFRTVLGMAVRNISPAMDLLRNLKFPSDQELADSKMSERDWLEKVKKEFRGAELAGRTLCVVGLGAIGRLIAHGAVKDGMRVVAYDPYCSYETRQRLSRKVRVVKSLAEVVAVAEILTVHVPLTKTTKGMVNAELLKDSSVKIIVNLSRDGIVDDEDIIGLVDRGELDFYVTDFPYKGKQINRELISRYPKIICLPHLGASTKESGERCTPLANEVLMNFLQFGITKGSVNFPIVGDRPESRIKQRLTVVDNNTPGMLAEVTSILGNHQLNITTTEHDTKGKIGYGLYDIDPKGEPITKEMVSELLKIEGAIRARLISLVT